MTMTAGNAAGVPTPAELAALRPALLRYARLQVRDAALAEDLVQAALLAALQGLAGFRGEASALTWVTGILKRKLVDHWRGVAREAPLPDADDDGDPDLLDRLFRADGHWASPPRPWDDPEESLSQEGFLAVFEACLKGLAGQAGRVFALREVLELEADEICKDLGITPSNYWVLMHRARLRLRACVEQGWVVHRGGR
jgi:RNA polymerase sigma-70 factor (ECF subfamily)